MSVSKNAAHEVMEEVNKVIIGKEDAVRKVMASILAGGHVLLEDVPGVGKTKLALAFSRAMGLSQTRIQFTPDVLPSDLTGFTMYEKHTGSFVYHPGSVMCNLLLADEINRTSPRTQSALLEVMEEGTVTVDGVTRQVPEPFIVLATQNPSGTMGTQKLPKSQMDRFLISLTLGYPGREDEIRMMKDRRSGEPLDGVKTVMNGEQLLEMRRMVQATYVHDSIYGYFVDLAHATRNHPLLELGLSPRASLALASMAKAEAFLRERNYVIPDDVRAVFLDVAVHRLEATARARMENTSELSIAEEILGSVKPPSPGRKKASTW